MTSHRDESRDEKKPEQVSGFILPALADMLGDVNNQSAQSLTSFERLCRENGLLTEINDNDYAEPRLAVTG